MAIIAFLSRSPGLLNRGLRLSGTWSSFQHLLSNSNCSIGGPEGPPLQGAGSRDSILSLTNSNFLCTELYYCFTPTQFNMSTVKVIPLIPSTGCTCYLHRCISYFDSSAGVNMQHKQMFFLLNRNRYFRPLCPNYLGCRRGVMVKVMDCGIAASEFVLQSRY